MKTIKEIKSILKDYKKILRKKYGVKEIGIFGSYVKGVARKNSDVDILVKFDRNIGLLKFINLENYLIEVLGIK